MSKLKYPFVFLFVLSMTYCCQRTHYGDNTEHGKVFKINDIDMYCEIYGKGEPLLLLHGNGASISSYSLQIPVFSKHFQVIAVDSRGQGKTTDADTIITYELMALDVAHLIDALGYQSVYIVGWSDGANTGLELAKAYPEKIKKMVMFAGNYRIDDHSVVTDWVYNELIKLRSNAINPTEWKLYDLCLNYPQLTEADLQNIMVPILVMAGDQDLILEEHTREMQQLLPNSKLYIAKGRTHYMPWEKRREFNKVVLEYLLN